MDIRFGPCLLETGNVLEVSAESAFSVQRRYVNLEKHLLLMQSKGIFTQFDEGCCVKNAH